MLGRLKSIGALLGAGLSVLSLVSCGPPAACEPPPRQVPGRPLDAPPEPETAPAEPPPAAAVDGEVKRDAGLPPPIPIPGWPLSISVPQGNKLEPSVDEFEIAMGWKVSVRIRRIAQPAPTDLGAYWDRQDFGDQRQIIQSGEAGELRFSVRSYRVRLGEKRGDTVVHYFERVTRVYAVLPIDSGTHALCTGYLEYGAERSDRELAKVLAVCESMHVVPPHQ